MQPDAPILYEEFGTNVAFSMHPPTDEIDKVFEQTLADGGVVVKQRMVNQRVAPVPMETRGVVAEYRKSDKTLTVWSSSQIPHLLRNILGALVGLPQHQVRVIVPEVGGGFFAWVPDLKLGKRQQGGRTFSRSGLGCRCSRGLGLLLPCSGRKGGIAFPCAAHPGCPALTGPVRRAGSAPAEHRDRRGPCPGVRQPLPRRRTPRLRRYAPFGVNL
jgi:hypothetical protein